MGIVFLIELAGLKGRERLEGQRVESVICYDGNKYRIEAKEQPKRKGAFLFKLIIIGNH